MRDPSRAMKHLLCGLLSAMAVILAVGCGQPDAPVAEHVDAPLRSPAEPLTKADIELFLRVVRAHPRGQAPEFAVGESDDSVNEYLPAAELAREFRQRFRRLVDPRRQGEQWASDRTWSKLIAAENIAPAEFAALVASVSCAVMRVRLDSRVDIDRVAQEATARAEDMLARIDRVDRISPSQRNRDAVAERTQAVIQLGRTIALLEFAELVRQVPESNRDLVRKYSAELKPLLPKTDLSEALADLRAWEQNEARRDGRDENSTSRN